MQPHIAQTIQDLTEEVANLKTAIRYLQKMEDRPLATEEVTRWGEVFEKGGHDPKPDVTPPQRKTRARKGGAKLSALDHCRQLGNPFKVADLAKATGLVNASSPLTLWSKKGWVKRVGKGTFERTDSFPSLSGDAAPKARTHGRITQPRLERALKEACEERDRYREQGNEKLEELAQAKVDDLSKRIEEAGA